MVQVAYIEDILQEEVEMQLHIQEELGGSGVGGSTTTWPNGGPGSDSGGDGGSSPREGSGGAGNPGGKPAYSTNNGTGGLLVLYSSIYCNAGNMNSVGTMGSTGSNPGGSSGGGSINIFCKNNIKNKGKFNCQGGAHASGRGGAGGNGTVTIGSISTGTFQKDE